MLSGSLDFSSFFDDYTNSSAFILCEGYSSLSSKAGVARYNNWK